MTLQRLARELDETARQTASLVEGVGEALAVLANRALSAEFAREEAIALLVAAPSAYAQTADGLSRAVNEIGGDGRPLSLSLQILVLMSLLTVLPSLLLMMTNKQTRKSYGAGWADVARAMVAMFRATHDVWAGDPAFTELLTRLRQGSPEFVKWWEAHDIRSTISGRKTMNHPTKGVLHFEHTSFQANDDPALKLVIYTPMQGVET